MPIGTRIRANSLNNTPTTGTGRGPDAADPGLLKRVTGNFIFGTATAGGAANAVQGTGGLAAVGFAAGDLVIFSGSSLNDGTFEVVQGAQAASGPYANAWMLVDRGFKPETANGVTVRTV